MRKTWTEEELLRLKEGYYELGGAGLSKTLGRSAASINDKARQIGLKNKKFCLKLDGGRRICSTCGQTKSADEFSKERGDCKTCNAEKTRIYQKLNPQKVLSKNRRWVEANKERVRESLSRRRLRNRERAKQKYKNDKEYREARIKGSREYRQDPKNKEKIRTTGRRLLSIYRKDPKFRIISSLRRRMLFVLAGKRKVDYSMRLIGCTREELVAHIEKQFKDGMSWENYGSKGWHIDHIKPCASFNLLDPEQQKICFHYTNLQPLWAKDNLLKGANFKIEIDTPLPL